MNNLLKTSETWCEYIPKEYQLHIIDPDGWDRQNYQYSFYEELISWEEFNKRLCSSTIVVNHNFFTDAIRYNPIGYLEINGAPHMPFTKEIYLPNKNNMKTSQANIEIKDENQITHFSQEIKENFRSDLYDIEFIFKDDFLYLEKSAKILSESVIDFSQSNVVFKLSINNDALSDNASSVQPLQTIIRLINDMNRFNIRINFKSVTNNVIGCLFFHNVKFTKTDFIYRNFRTMPFDAASFIDQELCVDFEYDKATYDGLPIVL